MDRLQNFEKHIGPRLVFQRTVDARSMQLYLGLIAIAFLAITVFGGWTGNPTLSFLTMVYWIVALIPIIITNGLWFHPLMFQMIYEVPKVVSLGTRAIGYVDPGFNFRNQISNADAVHAYTISVMITCIGLILEYIVVCAYRPRSIKWKKIELKKNLGVFILFIFAVGCFFLLIRQLGGLRYVLLHYEDRLVEFSGNTSQYLRYFVKYGILCVFYYYLLDQNHKFRITGGILILMFLAMGERGGLISEIVLPFAIAYMLKKKKNLNFAIIVIGAGGITLLYILFGIFRDPSQNVSMEFFFGNIISSIIHEISRILHFVISTELIWMVKNGTIAYVYGKPFINILFAPLPRSVFSWKPTYIAESFYVGSLILGENSRVYGLPPGPFAYGYLNFGLFGVIIFAIVSGLFMGWFYNVLVGEYVRRDEDIPNGNILLYSILLPFSMEILSTEVQINILIYLLGLGFILYVAKDRRRKHANR